MAIVQRANVVLDIADDEYVIDRYINDGFNLIDETGKVLKYAKPTTLEQYQNAYNEQRRLNDELALKVKQLETEIETLKNKLNSSQSETKEKPINTRARKKAQ